MEKNRKIRGPQARKRGATKPLLETYTRYSGVDHREQKKKVFGSSNSSFLRNFVGGRHIFLIVLKSVF